ncbi:unnamed protein product [marine sediment metagenome]|uniref:Uncharacterized protein n=2 Tax=marine sediment metagenome TaxID=412755 RepID=X1AYN9_9ZZZZ
MSMHDVWNNEELERDEYEFVPMDKIGTPTYFRVKDWYDIKDLSFRNSDGNLFSRDYLVTTKGLLPLSSIRLRRQLKPFADVGEKKELTIQKWCEGSDDRSTIYKVSLETGVISTKSKPKPKVKSKSK